MINHFGIIQLRVTGAGSLVGTLYSLPDASDTMRSEILEPLNMTTQTSREPVLLANFLEERAKLRMEVVTIDEKFTIKGITIFVKPTYATDPL